MPLGEHPEPVDFFLERIRDQHGTTVEVRETLTAGKSGAFVALVDCSGKHDGIFVLKVDALQANREDEEARHRRALAEHAFSDKLPAIILSDHTEKYYCLLIKIAGESRIAWRPLVNSLRLFRSAYTQFCKISWTPNLFKFGPQQSAATIVWKLLDTSCTQTSEGESKSTFQSS